MTSIVTLSSQDQPPSAPNLSANDGRDIETPHACLPPAFPDHRLSTHLFLSHDPPSTPYHPQAHLLAHASKHLLPAPPTIHPLPCDKHAHDPDLGAEELFPEIRRDGHFRYQLLSRQGSARGGVWGEDRRLEETNIVHLEDSLLAMRWRWR